MERKVKVFKDPDAVAQEALRRIDFCMSQLEGKITLALSGGTTPRRLYELMAKTQMRFDRLELYWGDERFVPHGHADSNFKMVKEALLDHVPIPADQIHPWPILATPEDSAKAYDKLLSEKMRGQGFDVVLLGLGEDGHTASLFPGTEALNVRDKVAVANRVDKLYTWRLTLTYPIFERSLDVFFLVCGASKAEILARVLAGEDFPSGRIKARKELAMLVDEAAAGRLTVKG